MDLEKNLLTVLPKRHKRTGKFRLMRWRGSKVLVNFVTACTKMQQSVPVRIRNGGVRERLKPAVLKNKIADSLADRKFN